MTSKALAVVTTGLGEVELQEVSIPEPMSEDVIVNISHSWISPGTERSFIMGERLNGETPRQPDEPLPFPLISGYQKVGTIEWVGSDVPELEIGMTVFVTVSKVEGMHFPHGGHISPAITHYSNVWQLPDGLSPVAYSGLVLTQVGFNCGMKGQIADGDIAVVIGDGLVGQWSAQTLLHRGAQVVLVGKHPYRLDFFKNYTQTRGVSSGSVADVTTEAGNEFLKKWADEGLQMIVDTVGSMESVNQLMPSMKRGGHIASAGFLGNDGLVDIQKLRFRELSLHAPSGWVASRIEDTMKLIACGVLQTEPLMTHRFPVSDAKKAFGLILNRKQPSLGVVLDWSKSK